MLINRVEQLSKLNDETCAKMRDVIAKNDQLGLVSDHMASLQQVYTRLLGWQDCARELLEIERADIRIDRKSVGDMIRRAAVNAS